MAGPDTESDAPPPPWAGGRTSLGASLAINTVAPLVLYQVIRPHVRSDAVALAIAATVPVIWILLRLLWRRRLDPIGVLAVAGSVSA
ncbi:MAG TPA: hypothetical protein VFG00_05735 [Acidothermaceae bacterium]|nr:hypothetical protein [Acidothermaceae bacterium]